MPFGAIRLDKDGKILSYNATESKLTGRLIFPYRFDFEMAPRDVTVTLFYSRQTETAWVFVREAQA